MKQAPVYFKGFNGLRFFAAFLVLLFHAELIRKKYGLPNFMDYSISNCGFLAVELFFVLSGFLITYLLLAEHKATGTISIKNFYLRRVLRIWPLYYIVLIIGLFLIPFAIKFTGIEYHFPFPIGTASLLYIFFVPNLVTTLWGSTFLYPLWSIGVEEQFYLIWAPLVKFFKKYALHLFIAIIGLRLIFYFFYNMHQNSLDKNTDILFRFIDTMKFESMSIGGIGAWFLFNYRNRVLSLRFFNKGFQVLFLIILLLRLFFHNTLNSSAGIVGNIYSFLFSSPYSTVVTSSLFLWLLINISSNTKAIISAENKVLNFLGSISYGIYMYHSIVIFIVMIFIKDQLRSFSPLIATITLYSISVGLTILVSFISFRYAETKFLLLKNYFTPKISPAPVT